MNSTAIIIILIIIIICILTSLYIHIYNKLTFYIIKINETEAQIDDNLRKKFDHLNKGISLIKSITNIKNETFDELTKLKSRKISNFDLDRSLKKAEDEYSIIVKKNKELSSNEDIQKIEEEVKTIETNLDNLRKYYNDNISNYNNLIDTFPTSIVATIKKYKEKLYYDHKDMSDNDYDDFKF